MKSQVSEGFICEYAQLIHREHEETVTAKPARAGAESTKESRCEAPQNRGSNYETRHATRSITVKIRWPPVHKDRPERGLRFTEGMSSLSPFANWRRARIAPVARLFCYQVAEFKDFLLTPCAINL